MIRELRTLRDFLTEENLKWLPGNLLTGQFILLKENIREEGKPYRQVIHLFDQGGTWIGTIEHPDWIPTKN